MKLEYFLSIFSAVSLAYFVFGLDDFFVDCVAWIKGLRPRALQEIEKMRIQSLPERRIAIMVAAWKEQGVLSAMIRGNADRLLYSNYDFYLGVYPNDEETLVEAQQLASEFAHVHVVVNSKPGPTSKGQMLNEIEHFLGRQNSKKKYDILMIHDAEDIIHPFSLKVVNWRTRFSDFVQIPVFSLPTPQHQLVAGLYVDEFAECHTKDVLVRQYLGASIPSAGVGTAMTKKYVRRLREEQIGALFNPATVTEDYQLGLLGHRAGLKTEFACYYFQEGKTREYIATREYFPKSFRASVRQRARWILGIAFQGYQALGWRGSLAHKYFLFRDRKAPVASLLSILGLLLLVPMGIFVWDSHHVENPELLFLANINLGFAMNRLVQRFISTQRVYGSKFTLLILPRIFLGNIINFLATIRAASQHAKYLVQGKAPSWAKTTHEMPLGFGLQRPFSVAMKSLPILALLLACPCFASVHSASSSKQKSKLNAYLANTICLYYDDVAQDHQQSNENDALLMRNLFGHFKKFTVEMKAVQTYQEGDLKHCGSAVYLGGIFDTPLSPSFLRDVAGFKHRFFWVGYNIWQLQSFLGDEIFKDKYGFEYVRTEESARRASSRNFYRYFIYKGETFEKFFQKTEREVNWDPSIVVVNNESAKVLSEAVHSGNGNHIPYVLNKENFFYAADRVFTYIHEADRYLIIADVLFDFLQQPASAGPRKAIVRLEDVSPNTDLNLLNQAIEALKKRKIHFAISLIPKYISSIQPDGSRKTMTLLDQPEFLTALRQAVKDHGILLLHGYTHQIDGVPDCPALDTAVDFEFWDRCHGKPLPFDSEDFVKGRLNEALSLLKQADLSIKAWVTPHYQASALDFKSFAKTFPWSLQRVIYVMDGNPSPDYENSQFFPYTIYQDYYGGSVLPENLGYFDESDPMVSARRIVTNAKRNRVLRDVWASFFWHPYLAGTPEGLKALEYTVDQLQQQGYVFTNLNRGGF